MNTAVAPSTQFHGLDALALRAPDGAQAIVTLHGGHVVSWIPAGMQDDPLYLSPRSAFDAGQPIRGGVPVVFPQFSNRGPLPRHGFARTTRWTLVDSRVEAGAAVAVLRLTDDAASRAVWPHAFALDIAVRVQGDSLNIELACRNTGEAAFSFAAALHTYLHVQTLEHAALEGLGGRSYWDSVDGITKTQTPELLQPEGEVDRVYLGAVNPLRLQEAVNGRRRQVHIAQHGFEDVVVWNPGAARCAALADMPPDGYRHMLCVEAARIGQPVTLAPGARWSGSQSLRAGGSAA